MKSQLLLRQSGLLMFVSLNVAACSDTTQGPGTNPCPPCWFLQGPEITSIMTDPGTAKFVLDGTTLEGPIAFGNADPTADGCFVGTSDVHLVSSPTVTSLPTSLGVYCQMMSSYPQRDFGSALNLPDLRDLGAGSYDLLKMGGSWDFRGTTTAMDGTTTDICSPSSGNASCTGINPNMATLALIVDEAVGSKSASPQNVTSDFKRTMHLQFNVDASATGHSLVVNATIPFTQDASSYAGADTVMNGCQCD